jgi:hypothetical protein
MRFASPGVGQIYNKSKNVAGAPGEPTKFRKAEDSALLAAVQLE